LRACAIWIVEATIASSSASSGRPRTKCPSTPPQWLAVALPEMDRIVVVPLDAAVEAADDVKVAVGAVKPRRRRRSPVPPIV
jgi:hypothetical protein